MTKFNITNDEPEDKPKSNKRKGKFDIKKQTQKSLARGFVKKKADPRVCIHKFQSKFARTKTTSDCYICSRIGKYKLGIPVKEGYSAELLDRFVCDIHRKELIACKRADIPFTFGICNYLPSEKWCPCFDIRIRPGKSEINFDKIGGKECTHEFEYEFLEAQAGHKCSICGNDADYQAKNYNNSDLPYYPIINFCEKHKYSLGCSKSEILCETAPCAFMERKSDCIFYSEN